MLAGHQANVGQYPAPPYFFGRFTNGPVWIEVAASILGQNVDNLAAGGANGNWGGIGVRPPFGFVATDFTVPVRSLTQQVGILTLMVI